MPQKEIDFAAAVLKDGTFECFYEDPSEVLPNLLRGEIIAAPGKKLIVADYSNVEGRVLAWLAGEEWKLQAFRDFDAGHGHDLYKLAYAKAFGVQPDDVTKPQRQIGKVLELALGYGGGAAAFARFASGYCMNLSEMSGYVKSTAPRSEWVDAADSYDYFAEKKMTGGLERTEFIACEVLKRLWRKSNPKIVEFWSKVGRAVQKAIVSRESVRVGYVSFTRTKSFLVARLPSGRLLCYPSPKTNPSVGKDSFTYMGMNQFSRKWEKIESYGAKNVENLTQAVACDLLSEGLLRMDAAGYKTILTIHDEAITEVPDSDEFTFQKMEHLMSELPDWAPGLPLVAAGYEAYRYRKD